MISTYFHRVVDSLTDLLAKELEQMLKASQQISQTIANQGIVHIFGCGHSHMIAEEVFYRAGGLVPINPILEESLMLHEGAVRSSMNERQKHVGSKIIGKYNLSKNDVVIVVSTSGRNPVPIDFAIAAKEIGCYVIAITSLKYKSLASRHDSGHHLSEVVDLCVDNHIEIGDAVLTHERIDVPFSSVSSIHNITMINAIIAQAIVNLADMGIQPPIFLSGNIDHADEHNMKWVNKYKDAIPLLNL